jgi:hypothetical protein
MKAVEVLHRSVPIANAFLPTDDMILGLKINTLALVVLTLNRLLAENGEFIAADADHRTDGRSEVVVKDQLPAARISTEHLAVLFIKSADINGVQFPINPVAIIHQSASAHQRTPLAIDQRIGRIRIKDVMVHLAVPLAVGIRDARTPHLSLLDERTIVILQTMHRQDLSEVLPSLRGSILVDGAEGHIQCGVVKGIFAECSIVFNGLALNRKWFLNQRSYGLYIAILEGTLTYAPHAIGKGYGS